MNENRKRPNPVFVRFADSDKRRLDRLVKKRGITRQDFLLAAALRALDAAEAGQLTAAEADRDRAGERESSRDNQPRGLGIRERLLQQREVRRADAEYDDEPRTATVEQHHHYAPPAAIYNTSNGAEVTALARLIVDTPPHERRPVWRRITEGFLREAMARASSIEEAQRLSLARADQLDAEVKRLGAAPHSRTPALDRARKRHALNERSANPAATPELDRVLGK